MPILHSDRAVTTEFYTPTIPGMVPDGYGPWEDGLVELRMDGLRNWNFMFCVKHPTAVEALDVIKKFRDGNVELSRHDKYYLGIDNPNDGKSGEPQFDATEAVTITVKLAPITLSVTEAQYAQAHAVAKKIYQKDHAVEIKGLVDFLEKSFEFSPGRSPEMFPFLTHHLKTHGFSYLSPHCSDDVLNSFRQAAQEAGAERILNITDMRVTEMIRASNYSRTNFVGLVENFKPEDAEIWVRMQNPETTPLWCSAAYTINRPRDSSEDRETVENRIYEIKRQVGKSDIPGVQCLSSVIEKFRQHQLIKLEK